MFYSSFRLRIGNKKFLLLTVMDLIILAALLIIVDQDYPRPLLIVIIALAMLGNIIGSIYLYRKAGKVYQSIHGDG